MARKETDVIEQLADTICNYIVYNGSKAGKETAPNDKTFSAVILGVNRKFADTVTTDDIENELNKFNIPETLSEGENSYYTFKINGVYYCKQQYGTFQLYDEIKVYIPNGDWSRMYFDYSDGSSHIESKLGSGSGLSGTLPELWVSVDAPGGNETKVNDLWLVVNADASNKKFTNMNSDQLIKVYQYSDEGAGIVGFHVIPCPIGTSYPGSIDEVEVGTIYIQSYINEPKRFRRIMVCKAKSGTITTWAQIYPDPDEGFDYNVIIRTDYPMLIGDHWIEIDSDETINAEGFYEYVLDETTGKQKWVAKCYYAAGSQANLFDQYEEPDLEEVTIKLGDYWIKTSAEESTNAVALYQYQYNEEDDENQWVLLNTMQGSGVGEWLDAGHTTERFNDYTNNTSIGRYDHIEGYNNVSQVGGDSCNHLEGNGNIINGYGERLHVEGTGNTVTACFSGVHVGGSTNTVIHAGSGTVVRGVNNTVTDCGSGVIVSGMNNTVNSGCEMSFISGDGNEVTSFKESIMSGSSNTCTNSDDSIVCGDLNDVTRLKQTLICGQRITNTGDLDSSVITGFDHNLTNVSCAGIFGVGHKGSYLGSVVAGSYSQGGTAAIYVGGGTENSPLNTFYVKNNGEVYAAGGYNATGADYAEFFEWADRNTFAEDRCGMLVTLSGDKIIPAHGDDILGAISAKASVVGNAYEEHWHGKYLIDVYDRPAYDEHGKPVLSPDYDPEREYIPRSQRPEWAVVGLVGRLIIRDDGSCKVGNWLAAWGGIAVPCPVGKTNVKMLKRIDKNHIEVLIK